MSSTLKLRKKGVQQLLATLNNSGASIAEARENEQEPKRYLVGEYDSGDLVWFWTVDSLDKAEIDINNHEAGSARDFTVFDLDTPGKEHRVSMFAKVQR